MKSVSLSYLLLAMKGRIASHMLASAGIARPGMLLPFGGIRAIGRSYLGGRGGNSRWVGRMTPATGQSSRSYPSGQSSVSLFVGPLMGSPGVGLGQADRHIAPLYCNGHANTALPARGHGPRYTNRPRFLRTRFALLPTDTASHVIGWTSSSRPRSRSRDLVSST